jgi:gamma-glutamylcyclotransferase (GGCT)/AIG2-like uncharacterized protein YtfP
MIKNLILAILVLVFTTGCNFIPSVEVSEEIPPFGVENEPKQNSESEGLFYFGYGSNMNHERMISRCGAEHFVDLGRSILDDYRFYFYGRGYANIQPQSSDQVEGVLYQIDNVCLQALDVVEGYPHVYQRDTVDIERQNQTYQAEVYIDLNDDTSSIPSDAYYQIVLTGAQQHALSADYINNIKTLAGH